MENHRLSEHPTCMWLTLNRECNLRCKWCYAQGTGYNSQRQMSLEQAYFFIDIAEKLHLKHITLIGGEPTCYKYLDKVISYCTKKNIKTGLVTNGVLLSNNNYLERLISNGLTSVNISIKAKDEEDYKMLTGVDCYKKVLKAIENLKNSKIQFTVSYVISKDTIDNFIDVMIECKKHGAYNFYLSFCNPFFDEDKINEYQSNPIQLIDGFVRQYSRLSTEIEKFSFHQNLPFCLWPEEFIEKAKPHMKSVCQMHEKKGLIVDTNGDLLLCNSLYDYPYGKFGEDYKDFTSLQEYLHSNKVMEIYKQVLRSPSQKCSACDSFKKCAGGCVLQWFSYSFDELMSMKKR